MVVEKLKNIESSVLLESYRSIESQLPWKVYAKEGGVKGKQVCLQYREGDDDIWTGGAGTQEEEESYRQINPIFRGTPFEKVISDFDLYRSRFMLLAPWSCYSMHVDLTPRLHIPLITNSQCLFVFDQGTFFLPEGWIYRVDTRIRHTAINGSDLWRLHFVGCLAK